MTQSMPNETKAHPIKRFISNNWKLLCFIIVVLLSILSLINALGFSTAWAYADVLTPQEIKDLLVYTQSVNDILVIGSLLLLGLVVVNLGLGSHNRKRYYWTNYVFVSLLAAVGIGLGAYMMYQSSALAPWFDYLFGKYDTEWRIVLFRNILKLNPPELGFTYVYDSLIQTSLIGISSIVSGVFGLIMVTVSALEHKTHVARECYVKERLEKIEKGEILVADKVVNMVPSVDFEINVEKLEETTPESIEFKKVERMRYLKNNLGYGLVMLSLIFFLVALFASITYNSYLYQESNDYPKVLTDMNLAIDIAISIVILLIGFLSAEKVKVYSKQYPFVIFVLAAINVYRIFTIPMSSITAGNITPEYFTFNILIPQLISVGLMVAAGVISLIRSNKLHEHLKSVGEK